MAKYMEMLIKELEEMKAESMMKDSESVRFTVTLSLDQMRRLEYFSKYFEVKRATFASDLIATALTEIEDKFHVTYKDFFDHVENKTDLTKMQKEYFSEVHRFGKEENHYIRDGKLTIIDGNGIPLVLDYSQEDIDNLKEGDDNE